MDLKKELIKLGKREEDLQRHIYPVVRYVEETQKIASDDSSILSSENILSTSPYAIKAFRRVILPQIETKIDSLDFEDISQLMDEVESLGGGGKGNGALNKELEQALIVHKPISKKTKQFFDEVKDAFKDWIRPRLKGNLGGEPSLDDGGSSDGGGKKEYNFTFK